jgi:hypothetical protein
MKSYRRAAVLVDRLISRLREKLRMCPRERRQSLLQAIGKLTGIRRRLVTPKHSHGSDPWLLLREAMEITLSALLDETGD